MASAEIFTQHAVVNTMMHAYFVACVIFMHLKSILIVILGPLSRNQHSLHDKLVSRSACLSEQSDHGLCCTFVKSICDVGILR